MPKLEIAHRFEIACDAARTAGEVARRRFFDREGLSIEHKGLDGYVTSADREVERLIKERVARAFPHDGFIGEEFGGTPKSAVWVVDPIDGTDNFARGIPQFVVSIAFAVDERVEVGVICDPIHQTLHAAMRGKRSTRNGAEIAVRTNVELSDAIVGVGTSRRTPPNATVGVIEKLLARGAQFRRFGSAATCLCYVADGRLDGFWQAHLSAWDALAGLLIVEQAGGMADDFFAHDGLVHGNATFACSRAIERELRPIVEPR